MTPPPAARPGGYLAFTSHFTTRTLATRLTAPLRVAGTVILNSSVWSSRLDGAILILVTCMDYSCSPCEDGAHCSVCCFLYDEKARSFLAPCIAPLGRTMTPTHELSPTLLGLHADRAARAAQSRSRQHPVQAGLAEGVAARHQHPRHHAARRAVRLRAARAARPLRRRRCGLGHGGGVLQSRRPFSSTSRRGLAHHAPTMS